MKEMISLKIFLRPKCYNKGNCVTRFINAKIYLEEGLYNEIRKKYPKRGLFMLNVLNVKFLLLLDPVRKVHEKLGMVIKV